MGDQQLPRQQATNGYSPVATPMWSVVNHVAVRSVQFFDGFMSP